MTSDLPQIVFNQDLAASAQRSKDFGFRIYDVDDDDNIYDTIGEPGDNLERMPFYTFSVPVVGEEFIYSFFVPYDHYPYQVLSDRAELRNALPKILGPSVLERYDGELQQRINRLLGPNDMNTFREFLVFVMHLPANHKTAPIYSIERILSWFVSRNVRLVEVTLASPFATMTAFLAFGISRSVLSHMYSW